MGYGISEKIRSIFIKLGIAIFCLGFSIATLMFILSFMGFQQYWIWSDKPMEFSLVIIMSGITIVSVFGTWIIFETRTPKTKILNIVFNYGAMLLAFGGGIIYLAGSFLLDNADVLLMGIRCYSIGVFLLIVRNTLVNFFMRWGQ